MSLIINQSREAPRWCFCRDVNEEIHQATMRRARQQQAFLRHDRHVHASQQLRIMACVVALVKTPQVQLVDNHNKHNDDNNDIATVEEEQQLRHHHHEYTLVLDDGTGYLAHCEIPPHMLQKSNDDDDDMTSFNIAIGTMVDVIVNIIIILDKTFSVSPSPPPPPTTLNNNINNDPTAVTSLASWLTIDTLILLQNKDAIATAVTLRNLQLVYNNRFLSSLSSSTINENHDVVYQNDLFLGYPSKVITSRTVYDIIQAEAEEGISLDDLCLCLLLSSTTSSDCSSGHQQQQQQQQQHHRCCSPAAASRLSSVLAIPVGNYGDEAQRQQHQQQYTTTRTAATVAIITTKQHVQDAILELQNTGQIYQNQQGSYQPL
jgi:hypothetical protein